MNTDQKRNSAIKDYDVPRVSVLELENSGCLCTSTNFDEKEGIEETTLYGDPIFF